MKQVDIIFSINVHENLNFLTKQINNIKTHVINLDYIIVLNTNNYMYNLLKNNDEIKNNTSVIVNENYIEKRTFTGSLLNGIFLNLLLSRKEFKFNYFCILSSRNMFYNILDNVNIKNVTTKFPKSLQSYETPAINYDCKSLKSWWWPHFSSTLLYKYVENNKLYFSSSAHEGLMFDYDGSTEIINFLHNNQNIKNNLFNFPGCVEEFALQTILINTVGYYWDLGNGVGTELDVSKLPKNKFLHKVLRI